MSVREELEPYVKSLEEFNNKDQIPFYLYVGRVKALLNFVIETEDLNEGEFKEWYEAATKFRRVWMSYEPSGD